MAIIQSVNFHFFENSPPLDFENKSYFQWFPLLGFIWSLGIMPQTPKGALKCVRDAKGGEARPIPEAEAMAKPEAARRHSRHAQIIKIKTLKIAVTPDAVSRLLLKGSSP
jgi:hypothetical protein